LIIAIGPFNYLVGVVPGYPAVLQGNWRLPVSHYSRIGHLLARGIDDGITSTLPIPLREATLWVVDRS